MATRTGVLSDASVIASCSIFRPIPLNMVKKLLHTPENLHTDTPFSSKKLKYINSVSRPADFHTLASALTRQIGGDNEAVRREIVDAYHAHNADFNGNGNGNVNEPFMHAHGQGFIPNPQYFNPPVYNFPDLDAAPYGALNFGHPMHGNGVGHMNIGNMKHKIDHDLFDDVTHQKAKHEHDFNAVKKHKIEIEDEDNYHVKAQKTKHNPDELSG